MLAMAIDSDDGEIENIDPNNGDVGQSAEDQIDPAKRATAKDFLFMLAKMLSPESKEGVPSRA